MPTGLSVLLLAVSVLVLPVVGATPSSTTTAYAAGAVDFSLPIETALGAAALELVDLNADGVLDAVGVRPATDRVAVAYGIGDGGFGTPIAYQVGSSPNAVRISDLDNDGRPDLVVANNRSKSLSVLYAAAAGGFDPAVSIVVGEEPYDLAIADFDGDARPDVAVTTSPRQNDRGRGLVQVVYGSGGRSFASAATLSTAPTSTVGQLRAADLNADGRADLLVKGLAGDAVSVLFSQGRSFQSADSYALPLGSGTIELADVTADGRPDLVVAAARSGTVAVRPGLGGGLFGAATDIPVGAWPTDLDVVDVTGDGALDLVVPHATTADSSITVVPGDGAGGFAAPTDFAAGGPLTTSVATGDLNGDGQLDLLVSRAAPVGVAVLLNTTGAAGLSVDDVTVSETGGAAVTATFTVTRSGVLDRAVTATVATADGTATAGSDYVAVSLGLDFAPGQTTVTVEVAILADTDPEAAETFSLVLADATGATLTDATGRGTILDDDGSALITWGSSGAIAGPGFAMAVADLDRDGRSDLVMTGENVTNSVSVRLGTATGYGPRATYLTGLLPVSVAVGDVTGDGLADVVVTNLGAASLSILRGDGTGRLAAATFVPTDPAPSDLAIGDVTGDGVADIVVAGRRTVRTLIGNGSGGFTADTRVATGLESAVTIADVNSDGVGDVIVAGLRADRVSLLPRTGAIRDYVAGTTPGDVTAGDLDGDGHVDLVSANTGSGDISVLYGNGAGQFAAASTRTVGPSPTEVRVVDVNGDGLPDLATLCVGDSTVHFLVGRTGGSPGQPSSVSIPVLTTNLALLDDDGDGLPDLVVSGSDRTVRLSNTTVVA